MPASPGKSVAQKTYLHISSIQHLDGTALTHLGEALDLAKIQSDQYNVIRHEEAGSRICLLNYQDFFDDPFPALRESWLVDLETGQTSYRTYEDSLNPPILHRKELLLPEQHHAAKNSRL